MYSYIFAIDVFFNNQRVPINVYFTNTLHILAVYVYAKTGIFNRFVPRMDEYPFNGINIDGQHPAVTHIYTLTETPVPRVK